MSVGEAFARARLRHTERDLRSLFRAVLFGDRVGLTVFLGCLCLFGLLWRTSFFITDSYTVANGLYSLSNGEYVLTEAAYGPNLDTPGAERVGDERIARNYGAIVLSVPFLLLVEGLDAVADLRIGVVALWSLVSLAFVARVGRLLDSDRAVVVGGLLVVGFFGANVALARPLDGSSSHLYALQLFHLTVAAFAVVLLYRLFARMYAQRVGLTAAVLFALGTPLALWAPVPKRHVLTAAAVLGIAYCLYRSRTPADGELVANPVTFRAAAYALVGLYAWVHAPEALLFCAVLALVDVPTAPDNRPRTLALVAGAFLLSLVPFFVTNALVAGSPVRPPRLLARSGSVAQSAASTGGGGSGSAASAPSGGDASLLAPVVATAEPVLRPLTLLFGELVAGLSTALDRPAAVSRTLVRSGYASGTLDLSNREAVNLSLLESAPVLAATAAVVPAARRWLRGAPLRERVAGRELPAARVVDLFAVLAAVGVTLMYAGRLPVHAQVTVRYLFPLFPLGCYLLVRSPLVRATLVDHWRTFAWTTAVATLIGGQLLVVAVALGANGVGEAFQLHALVSLATAVPLGLWSVAGRPHGRSGQTGAALLGLATAGATLFCALTALEYYALGNAHAFPVVRALARLLSLL